MLEKGLSRRPPPEPKCDRQRRGGESHDLRGGSATQVPGLHRVDVGLRNSTLNDHGNVVHAASLSYPIFGFGEYQWLHCCRQLRDIFGRIEGRVGGPGHEVPQAGDRIRRDRCRAANADPL